MQIIVNGIASGSCIALLALAFQIVYLPTRLFFMGLAGVWSATPYVAYELSRNGCPWGLTTIAAVAVGCLICLLCEWAIHAPLESSMASSGGHLIASLGTSITIVQAVAIVWGNDPKSLRIGLQSVTSLGPIVVTSGQIVTFGSSALTIVCFMLFLGRSTLGLRLRAIADNPQQFNLHGYAPHSYRYLSFGLSGLLATIAALAAAYDTSFDPHSGMHALLLAVVAVIIGGKGSFVGPVLGGLVLGVVRAEVAWYWSASWQQAVTFVLLTLVLLFAPHGLVGRSARIEANV